MLRTKLLALAVLLGASAMNAEAELQFDKPIQEFQRTPDDKFVEARFAFRNKGSQPVTIKSVRTSCGCTTADLPKKTYAPGEQGEITTKFTFGGRTGPQRKTITVNTDDRPDMPTILDLRVMVQEGLNLSPALVFWRRGEDPTAKTVQLAAVPGRPVTIKAVRSSSPRVSAKLETIKPGEQYVLLVTPADTAQKEAAEIHVQTDFPPDAPRSYTIHARVK